MVFLQARRPFGTAIQAGVIFRSLFASYDHLDQSYSSAAPQIASAEREMVLSVIISASMIFSATNMTSGLVTCSERKTCDECYDNTSWPSYMCTYCTDGDGVPGANPCHHSKTAFSTRIYSLSFLCSELPINHRLSLWRALP